MVAMIYLVKKRGMTLSAAYAQVAKRRSISQPSETVMAALITYELHVLGRNSVSMDDYKTVFTK